MSKRVKSKGRTGSRRSGGAAERSLEEYEAIQGRRERERQRQMGAAMTGDKMDRTEAIAIVDRTHHQYVEAIRTGICPACEALMTTKEVEDDSEIPAASLENIHRSEQYLEQKADGVIEWAMTHLESCTFLYHWQHLPKFCEVMGIRTEPLGVALHMPNGQTWVEVAEIRVPDEGDPPVEEDR